MTKYKGKNVRISDTAHEKLEQLPKKIIKGAWVEEAIDEKFEREKKTETTGGWPVKIEVKDKFQNGTPFPPTGPDIITASDCITKFDETVKIPEVKDFKIEVK